MDDSALAQELADNLESIMDHRSGTAVPIEIHSARAYEVIRLLRTGTWPEADSQADLLGAPTECNSKKMGEFNSLRCCRELGHTGDHNYVLDHREREGR